MVQWRMFFFINFFMFPIILPEKDMSGAVEDVFVFVFCFLLMFSIKSRI